MFNPARVPSRILALSLALSTVEGLLPHPALAEVGVGAPGQSASLLVGFRAGEELVPSALTARDVGLRALSVADMPVRVRSGLNLSGPKAGNLAATAAGTALLMATDESVQRWINRKVPPEDRETDLIQGAGLLSSDLFALGLSAALIYTGTDEQRETGRLLLSSSFQTWVTVGVAKLIFGRERPEDSGGETRFHPFSIGNFSFPSFDAANAFSMATILGSRDTHNRSVYYSLATALALLRVLRNKHFPSDVFVGALLGTGIARSNLAGRPLFLGGAFEF